MDVYKKKLAKYTYKYLQLKQRAGYSRDENIRMLDPILRDLVADPDDKRIENFREKILAIIDDYYGFAFIYEKKEVLGVITSDIDMFSDFICNMSKDQPRLFIDVYEAVHASDIIKHEDHRLKILNILLECKKLDYNYDENNIYVRILADPDTPAYYQKYLELFEPLMQKNGDPIIQQLIQIKKGDKIEPTFPEITINQVANIYKNYYVVDRYYDKYVSDDIKKTIEKIRTLVNKDRQVAPPLWLDNVSQMRDSIKKWFESVPAEDMIWAESIEKLEIITGGQGRFTMIKLNGKRWIVKDGFGRYFGARHLKQHGLNAANKKLLFLSKDVYTFDVTIRTSDYPIIAHPECYNIYCLTELVPGGHHPGSASCPYELLSKYGFYDKGNDNCFIRKTSEGKYGYIVIDTELNKNFYDNGDDATNKFAPKKFRSVMNYNFNAYDISTNISIDLNYLFKKHGLTYIT